MSSLLHSTIILFHIDQDLRINVVPLYIHTSGPKSVPKCHNNKAASVDGVARSASGSPFSKALHIYRPVCRVTGEGSLTYNSVVVYVNQHYVCIHNIRCS